jgi:hypothetical protein
VAGSYSKKGMPLGNPFQSLQAFDPQTPSQSNYLFLFIVIFKVVMLSTYANSTHSGDFFNHLLTFLAQTI